METRDLFSFIASLRLYVQTNKVLSLNEIRDVLNQYSNRNQSSEIENYIMTSVLDE